MLDVTDAAAAPWGLAVSEMDPAQYRRVQRVRSKKATDWLERGRTFGSLMVASVVLAPAERLMRAP